MPESTAPPTCSVLVPVLNEAAAIRRAVAAMSAQKLAGGIEILLIDGGSVDGTREILAELAGADPRIRLLENPRGLIPAALNIGLAQARGRYVARMDAHSVFGPDYLARGIARLERGDCAWVSGPQLPVGENRASRAIALALSSWLGSGPSRRWASRQDGAELELDSGVFCGVWARETLLAFDGWDEGWRCNEDSEMAGRFHARGKRLICLPAMVARYSPRPSLPALFRQYRQYGEFRTRTAVRHPHTLRRSHMLAPTVTLMIPAAALPWLWVAIPARVGLALYLLALTSAGHQARRAGAQAAEAALVPVVLATMHLAHGSGFLQGMLRHGVPVAALARVLGAGRLSRRLGRGPVPVQSPALSAPTPRPSLSAVRHG